MLEHERVGAIFFGCDNGGEGNELLNYEDDVGFRVCVLRSPRFAYVAFDHI